MSDNPTTEQVTFEPNSNPQEAIETIIPSPVEEAQEIKEMILDPKAGNGMRLLTALNWNLRNLNIGEETDKRKKIGYILRSLIAEEISKHVPTVTSNVVYETHDITFLKGNIQITSKNDFVESLINESVKLTGYEHYASNPFSLFGSTNKRKILESLFPNKTANEISELYKTTTSPDQYIVYVGENSVKETIGFVEVKAYKPEEVIALVAEIRKTQRSTGELSTRAVITTSDGSSFNAGVNLDGEVRMVDLVRKSKELPELGKQQRICIRFPAFTPSLPNLSPDRYQKEFTGYENAVKEYGAILQESGYTNFTIEFLPFNILQMESLVSNVIKQNLRPFVERNRNNNSGEQRSFGNDEIRILNEMAEKA